MKPVKKHKGNNRKLLLTRQNRRFALFLCCTILFQQHLQAQTKVFILPTSEKRYTFQDKDAAGRKWFELNRKTDSKESWYEYIDSKINKSGTSVDVITQFIHINRAGEGGAEKPETVKDPPDTESTNIEIEEIEDQVKEAEKPVAAVVKESAGAPAKGTKARAAEKPTAAANKNLNVPPEEANIEQRRTEPSKEPDEQAKARGRSDLETGRVKDAAPENERAYKNERPVADALAKAGYDVAFTEGRITPEERAAEGIRATANPDLRVEGKLWDIYSPGPNTTPASAAAHVFDKVRALPAPQTRRVIISLDALSVTLDQFRETMRNQIGSYGNYGMQEIFAVQKGKVYRIYPF